MRSYPPTVGFWIKIHPKSIFSGQTNIQFTACPQVTWLGFPVFYPASLIYVTITLNTLNFPVPLIFWPPFIWTDSSLSGTSLPPYLPNKLLLVHQLRLSWNESLLGFPGLPYSIPPTVAAKLLTSHLFCQSTYIAYVSLSQCIVICVHIHISLPSRQSF